MKGVKKMIFLDRNGTLIKSTFSGLKAKLGLKNLSWESMHTIHRQDVNPNVVRFLRGLGLQPTIFHHDNLEYYGITHLYPHEYEPLLEKGKSVYEVKE